jgi:hypothetical protein
MDGARAAHDAEAAAFHDRCCMTNNLSKRRQGELALYDPEKGLKSIAVASAAEKFFAQALRNKKLPPDLVEDIIRQLNDAVEIKIVGQAKYVV